MTNDVTLPPLPEPCDLYGQFAEGYEAEHMQTYALQAVLMERERCAKLCETLEHGAFGPPSYLQGVKDGAIGCANAIRSGK